MFPEMPGNVSDWIQKFAEAIDAVDWDLAARRWEERKTSFIREYTDTVGLSPTVAEKYRRKVERARYRKPDAEKMKSRYAAAIRAP